jgi:hypothetical protein
MGLAHLPVSKRNCVRSAKLKMLAHDVTGAPSVFGKGKSIAHYASLREVMREHPARPEKKRNTCPARKGTVSTFEQYL